MYLHIFDAVSQMRFLHQLLIVYTFFRPLAIGIIHKLLYQFKAKTTKEGEIRPCEQGDFTFFIVLFRINDIFPACRRANGSAIGKMEPFGQTYHAIALFRHFHTQQNLAAPALPAALCQAAQGTVVRMDIG